VLTVLACAIAGVVGVRGFVRAMNEPPPEVLAAAAAAAAQAGTELPGESAPRGMFSRPSHVDKNVWQLLGWWVALYVFVGIQMGWILRPFIGSPELPFILFRGKSGSMIESTLHHLRVLFGG
jgi:hypothetical protein